MKLLAGRNREKYGEVKIIEVNWKDWDGDVSKLSPAAVRGLLDVLRKEAARQEKARAEESGKVVEVQSITSGSDDESDSVRVTLSAFAVSCGTRRENADSATRKK
jgi:hypothetical protein